MSYRMNHKRASEAGVTLVEVAIVLVIMGMLIAGIVAAQQLIAAAKVRAMVREIENKLSAVESFTDKFRAYPGDMVNAQTFFTTSRNGDGNGRITYITGGEGNLAWQHLSLSGLVEGVFQATAASDILDTNVPRSNAAGGGAGYAIDYNTTMGNHLILGLADGQGVIDDSAVTPDASFSVDRKMDDGVPTTGVLRATNSAGGTG